MESPKDEIIIASDVNRRDGIGIQFWRNNEILIEIFRDDSEKTRKVTLYKEEIDLELIEKTIVDFKNNIPWDFINYENLE